MLRTDPDGGWFRAALTRAQRTMAPVGPLRNASVHRPGLQLPGTLAARRAGPLPHGGHLVRSALGGRRSQDRQEKGLRPCPWWPNQPLGGLQRGTPRCRTSAYEWVATQAERQSCPARRESTRGENRKLEKGKEWREGRAGSAEWIRVGWVGLIITSLGK